MENTIKTIRKQTGLSQSAFAEHFGISVRTLQRWEQGQSTPPAYLSALLEKAIQAEDSPNYVYHTRIPEEFRHVFWDVEFDTLDVNQQKYFIICRMYCKGGIEGIRWVENHFTYADIREAAKIRRDLNPIVANHLKNRFCLRKEDMQYYRYNSGGFYAALRDIG